MQLFYLASPTHKVFLDNGNGITSRSFLETGWPDPDFINQKPQADVSDTITGNYIYEKVHQIHARGPRTMLLIYLKNHNMW
jgi:hypothetical protein